ncbi:hypothetical protein HPB49_021516 [Dermacentor silvarum]|uniref:Uncharacterized protein n=1 Tax=Dermacentor silvarum TaxID=543639 RepID=A0ACB8E2P6_DERSI|nr:hypothetical protein HPB49_021516 [Dermacentor silvarum]
MEKCLMAYDAAFKLKVVAYAQVRGKRGVGNFGVDGYGVYVAGKPSRPTGILKTPTADRRDSGEEMVPDMIVVPLTSWAGTPDVTADRKCALPPVSASTCAESSAFADRSHTPQQDTSLVRHRGKKTHFGVPSLKVVSPLTLLSPRRGLIIKGAVILVLLFSYCDSTDCYRYEVFIGASLNRSINPCDDFRAFVCSAWKEPSVYHHISRSSREDVVDAWSKNFELMLRRGKKYLAVAEKPLGMLSLCKYISLLDSASGTETLQRFMEERKIRWPGQPFRGANPLGVLLDLGFNWGLPLWFHVEFLRKQGSRWPARLAHQSGCTHSRVAESPSAASVYWQLLRLLAQALQTLGGTGDASSDTSTGK